MGKVQGFKQFLSSRRGQIMFNFLYSWGASVVILGAMCKIMHIPGGDYVLMTGLIVEAIVFFAAGFDYSTAGNVVNAGSSSNSGSIVGGAILDDLSTNNQPLAATAVTGKRGGSGSVVIIGGGGSGVAGAGISSGTASSTSSGTTSSATGNVAKGVAPEYTQSLNNTAQNLDEFSNTIHSLNEASQKMLNAYTQVTENKGFAENLATFNQNVSGLNDVFNSQLQTITEQMSAIRYINDSLQRMKNLYDGAIGDSYMFKEESAKMTKHIEALNNVYARLLQAMTTNNNNMNQTNF